MTRIKPLVHAILIITLTLLVTLGAGSGSGAHAAPGGRQDQPPVGATDTNTPGDGEVDPQAAEALARERGITPGEAKRQLANQKTKGEKGKRLEQALGERTGGSYLDDDGNLVVTTLDPAADAAVTREGARPVRVANSKAKLDSIKQELDDESAKGAGSLQGWYVDVMTNSVVVTATAGSTDERAEALKAVALKHGASVRIEERSAEEASQGTVDFPGGVQFVPPSGGTCSTGFNTIDAYNRNVVLTAGHCLPTTGNVSRNGYLVGPVRNRHFPSTDFGTFWNSYPSYWQPRPWVTSHTGTNIPVRGIWENPSVGARVCKSGRTTGWTCGTIRVVNESVVWRDGTRLYGMVRHDACVQPGDSGGSNISNGGYALGITSSSNFNATTKLCASKHGGTNVSYYQPVGPALRANGLRILYQP